ncbi:MAG: pyridoxine 5'-phosphate synthase [Deltaproteobacteria bacterium]|nr:pyridoxine 5'-phosphate synthase [Deltaproteobacteria bacterium]
MAELGVNIDHVAPLRQARGVAYPDPIAAARAAAEGGADGITVHLREDRRHLRDDDVLRLRAALRVGMNLEMAATDAMVAIALRIRPAHVCLVPERRAEITTEGGLDVAGQQRVLADVLARLRDGGIRASLFVDPDPAQLDAAATMRAAAVELHTGRSCAPLPADAIAAGLAALRDAAEPARALGMIVNAGHGRRLDNVRPIAERPHVDILNIGHSIVARAVFVGMTEAVREMRALVVAP